MKFSEEFYKGFTFRGNYVEIFLNPTLDEAKDCQFTSSSLVRGIFTSDIRGIFFLETFQDLRPGDLLVWKGEAIHSYIYNFLGIKDKRPYTSGFCSVYVNMRDKLVRLHGAYDDYFDDAETQEELQEVMIFFNKVNDLRGVLNKNTSFDFPKEPEYIEDILALWIR